LAPESRVAKSPSFGGRFIPQQRTEARAKHADTEAAIRASATPERFREVLPLEGSVSTNGNNPAIAEEHDAAMPTTAKDSVPCVASPVSAPLSALCLIARLHHIAAEPAHLAHQLGWPASHEPDVDDLLLPPRPSA